MHSIYWIRKPTELAAKSQISAPLRLTLSFGLRKKNSAPCHVGRGSARPPRWQGVTANRLDAETANRSANGPGVEPAVYFFKKFLIYGQLRNKVLKMANLLRKGAN